MDSCVVERPTVDEEAIAMGLPMQEPFECEALEPLQSGINRLGTDPFGLRHLRCLQVPVFNRSETHVFPPEKVDRFRSPM